MKINWLTICTLAGILNSATTSAKTTTLSEASTFESGNVSIPYANGAMRETLMEAIIMLVADVIGIDESEITPQTTFEDLKADSFSMVEISLRCRESYNVEISDIELKTLTDINSLHDLVHRKIVEDSSKKPNK